MGWSVLFPKKKNSCMALRSAELLGRQAVSSILRLVLDTTALCSLSTDGSADEKDHSSSSFAISCDDEAAGGWGVAGFGVAGFELEPRMENGSAAGFGGAENADDRDG
jgi:hypothetical protein